MVEMIGTHTVASMRREIRHKTVRIANRWIGLYGAQAEEQVRKLVPECIEKELLITAIMRQRKVLALKRHNRLGY